MRVLLFINHSKALSINNYATIYSFRLVIKSLFKSTTTQRRFRQNTDTVSKFHAEAPQATLNEGLAQGLYGAARAGVEPMTLRTKGVDSTNAPHTPHKHAVNEAHKIR